MRAARRGALAAPLLAISVAGCLVGPNFRSPVPTTDTTYTRTPLPATTEGAASGPDVAQRLGGSAVVFGGPWWRAFDWPMLDKLETEALGANATLASTKATLRQARELVLAQQASMAPNVGLGVTALRAKNAQTIAPPLNSGAEVYSLYGAQLDVSYVFDLFGGERRSLESARAGLEAQKDEADGVALALTANVAQAALQIAGLRDQLKAAQAIVEADRRTLAITEHERARGEASDSDVASARSALEQAEQAPPALSKPLEQQADMLAVLLGRTPSKGPEPQTSLAEVTLPRDLPVALPADMLRRRPDVRAAEALVHAASAQVGVALAARLPNISLNGTAGGASSTLASLFSDANSLWSIGAGATQTVFDAGALRHKQRAAEAALDSALAQYRVAVLTGLQNTTDTLQAIVADAAAARHAGAAEEAAEATLAISQAQYAQGQIGALPALSAEAAADQARLTLTQARLARLTDTVALYQALGGGWAAAP